MIASSTFSAFLQPDINRPAFISAWLRTQGVPFSIVKIGGKQHIIIRFESGAYDPRFRMKTLVAHHDRVPGSPGANDNSAACFQLMNFAAKLALNQTDAGLRCHNIRIILTDGEEAAGTEGIVGQGSYALGFGLRKLGITKDDVFVFDACGRGDTIIVSTTGIHLQGGKKLGNRLEEIHEYAGSLARKAAKESWMRLPTPYSDNVGFITSGIAAQTITVLPSAEASALLAIQDNAESSEQLLKAILENSKKETDPVISRAIPLTWKLMHTPGDTIESLTPAAELLMNRYLNTIASSLIPLA